MMRLLPGVHWPFRKSFGSADQAVICLFRASFSFG